MGPRDLKFIGYCTLMIIVVYAAIAGILYSLVPHWPPAVVSLEDIEKLPTSQRDIRGINVGEAEIKRIAERFPRLKYLFLNSGSQVTDDGVIAISKLKDLCKIVIFDGSALSDKALIALGAMPALRELVIENGFEFTDASLDAITQTTNLQMLYLSDCPQITAEARDRFRRQFPTYDINFD